MTTLADLALALDHLDRKIDSLIELAERHDAALAAIMRRLKPDSGIINGVVWADAPPAERPITDRVTDPYLAVIDEDATRARPQQHGHAAADDGVEDASAPAARPAADTLAALQQELAEYGDEDDELPPPDEDDELPPPPDEADLWEGRLRLYQAQQLWMPDWGPRPGQRGCMAPPDIVEAVRLGGR